jgi:hypothetical protein
MELMFDNLVCISKCSDDLTFSIKGELPLCCDSIVLPGVENKPEKYFTFSGCFSYSVFEFVKSKLYSLSISISDAVFHSAKRVLRRAVAGVRHFVCSNQRGKRRAAPLVPMALRL